MIRAASLLALAFTILALVPAETGYAQPEAVPWTARPDPLPYKMPAAKPGDKPIALGKNGDVVFPTSSSPFACVVVPVAKMPSELRMIDLSKVEQVGQSIKAEEMSIAKLCVSPFGDAVASLELKAEKPTVKVLTFDGKEPRSIVVSETKASIVGLDFAGKGQLLVVKHIHDIQKKIYHDEYEVWDIATGKMAQSFHYPVEYNVRWIGFSPGRNYLAMEQNSNDGYFFMIWDLKTGKLAGKLEVQPKKEGFGIASGIAFSPDGKEAALLWQQGGGGMYGKIHRFDIEKGVKKGVHVLGEEIKASAPGFGNGGMTALQYLPDGRGWLLCGHQIIERETGKVVWKIGPAPGYEKATHERRFIDPYHVTTTHDKKFAEKNLTLLPQAPADFDAAFKNAGGK